MSDTKIPYPPDSRSPLQDSLSAPEREKILQAAQDKDNTPFDYIIVGSGPGGGPLAARLALAGKRVLLIDAGHDPSQAEPSAAFPHSQPGEVHDVPGYHGASTEDSRLSWMFSVRHFDDDTTQKKDLKYNYRDQDPNGLPGAPLPAKFLDGHGAEGRKQGIFYPRSTGLGGCTGHHAMIMMVPNEKDWNYIAELTGDKSWQAPTMHTYFTKLESCHYLDNYDNFIFNKWLGLGWLYKQGRRCFGLWRDRNLARSGHGFSGWQPTDFIDPKIVEGLDKRDRPLFDLLLTTAVEVLHSGNLFQGLLANIGLKLRLVQALDINDPQTRRIAPEGVFLVPTGARTDADPDEERNPQAARDPQKGRRYGIREFLLNTQNKHPDRLVLLTGAHVTRVLFRRDSADQAPRAVGVEVAHGDYLYEASPERPGSKAGTHPYFAKSEVILCGGAFNTPQILMLSGIGDTAHLQKLKIRGPGDEARNSGIIHLPGVGRNLQDWYEISVVSELKSALATFQRLSLRPGDPDDDARKQWLRDREGVYSGNGTTLAILRKSSFVTDGQPDIVILGLPVSFSGYYWNWSREILKKPVSIDASGNKVEGEDSRQLWSWLILKAYTDNDAGTVRLVSDDPFVAPAICFNSFERSPANHRNQDIEALGEAVEFVRRINKKTNKFKAELQPGPNRPSAPAGADLQDWIKTQCWGHHACGTCRIGADSWVADATKLRDEYAVVDGEFRVHGVHGLRVVDASVFPKIPGYFIAAPIMMISEKAADTILAENPAYPKALAQKEAELIRQRRKRALLTREALSTPTTGIRTGSSTPAAESSNLLPPQTVGLAFSGGGIRSATICLGVIQALAQKGRLVEFDFLSTVSGGGYLGSFLGRCYTRLNFMSDPAGVVQKEIGNIRSAQNEWLRDHQNYIAGVGASDVQIDLAILWRNITAITLVWSFFFLGIFGLLVAIGQTFPGLPGVSSATETEGGTPGQTALPVHHWPWEWSPLTLLVPVIFFGLVLPQALSFWLTPRLHSKAAHPLWVSLGWMVLMAGAVSGLLISGATTGALITLVVLLLAFIWQATLSLGFMDTSDPIRGEMIRNRVTSAIGFSLLLLFGVGAVALIDSAAATLAVHFGFYVAILPVAIIPFMPVIKASVEWVLQVEKGSFYNVLFSPFLTPVSALLSTAYLLVIATTAHAAFDRGTDLGLWMTAVCLLFSAVIGRAVNFINLSSLHSSYSARLIRTYLGASNPRRVNGGTSESGQSIAVTQPDDDVPWYDYKPHENGGPLHFVNVCLNETIDPASQRINRDRKGVAMSVGPTGVSVGTKYHAMWTEPEKRHLAWMDRLENLGVSVEAEASKKTWLKPIVLPGQYGSFHPFAYAPDIKNQRYPAPVAGEPLTLGQWIGVSGAAFTTGLGRSTSLGLALLLGMINLRLGYWWDSGINADDRPDVKLGGLSALLDGPLQALYTLQRMFVQEFTARFGGPSQRYWYLSDGGHFEVLGCYELIRRRTPFIVCVDAGADSDYEYSDLAMLTRLVRVDFGAEISFLEPERSRGATKWAAFAPAQIPKWIQDWIDPDHVGSLATISSLGESRLNLYHAALAQVQYKDDGSTTWLLVLKSSLTGDETNDVIEYAKEDSQFPHNATYNQFYSDSEWESYRGMGFHISQKVFTDH